MRSKLKFSNCAAPNPMEINLTYAISDFKNKGMSLSLYKRLNAEQVVQDG